jgi:hypothetical protein
VGYNFFGSDHPDLFGNYTASMLTLLQVPPLTFFLPPKLPRWRISGHSCTY